MPNTPLTDFLASLSDDSTLEAYNSMSVSNARAHLQSLGLDQAQRDAVIARDVTKISYQLSLEGTTQSFFVPAGPTMNAPARFLLSLQGTMDPLANAVAPPLGAAKPSKRKPIATRAAGATAKRAHKTAGKKKAAKAAGKPRRRR
jgi:hypothetical protein